MLHEILIQFWPALMYGVLGAIIFSLIGMVSGTDETRSEERRVGKECPV